MIQMKRQTTFLVAALGASLLVHAVLLAILFHRGLPQTAQARLAGGVRQLQLRAPKPIRVQTVDIRDLVFHRGAEAVPLRFQAKDGSTAAGGARGGTDAPQQVRELFEKMDLAPKAAPKAELKGLGRNVIAPKPQPGQLPPSAAAGAPAVKILEIDTARLGLERISADRPLTAKIPRQELTGGRIPGISGGGGAGVPEAIGLSMRLGQSPVIPLRPGDLQQLTQAPDFNDPASGRLTPLPGLLGADGAPAGRLEGFVTVAMTVYAADGGGGFFRIDIAPNPSLSAFNTVGKDLLFLVDCSASITASTLNQFKDAVVEMMKELRPSDRFNVVAFRDQPEALFPDLVAVTPANREKAANFINRQDRGGLTDVYRSLAPFVQNRKNPAGGYRPLNVFLLSDGKSTVRNKLDNDTFIRETVKLRRPEVSIYSFSAGRDANLFLLDLLAYSNRGLSLHEENSGRFVPELVGFVRTHSEIAVADLRWDVTGGLAGEIVPKELPHLYRNETLSLYGRFPPGTEQIGIRIAGRDAAGQEQELVFSGDFRAAPRTGAKLALDWASQKVFHLLAERVKSPSPATDAEIRHLAETYKLFVPYLDKP